MFKRILVAADGGATTQPVLEIACTLADKHEAKLAVLCVVVPDEVSDDVLRGAQTEGIIKATGYAGFVDVLSYGTYYSAEHTAESRRAELVARVASAISEGVVTQAKAFSEAHGVKAVKTFVRSGNVVTTIIETAEEAGADLIVMGHHHRSLLGDLFTKSVAEEVEHRAKCPCLVLSIRDEKT
jgi:nucleotide-binding universal stress UspA family protein